MGGSTRRMHGTSILLADDDERFRGIVRGGLEDDGYSVIAEAGTAEDTLEMARTHRPDVVVLDLVMIGSHGLSTARDLLADEPRRPVVVISSLFDPLIEREAAGIGAWYLEKVEGIEALEHLIDTSISVSHPR